MIKKGEIVYGKITNILGYGAFVTVDDYDGLIHISEFSDNYVRKIDDYVSVGQKVKLKVLEVDEKLKRLKLSYKFLNKKRGVKGEVPKYRIGFKSLQAAVPAFIQKQLEVIKKRPLKSNLLEEGKMKIHY
ncbi:MAG: S1 RNA-binding domain-containing protein [Bacilli bacterium]|jgi:general stress protein 13